MPLALACQIARALAFAHALGIVHRDVKPHNVLLDGSGTAKVTDFGIARALDSDDAITATGTVIGTGQYISPEQANGQRGNERSDQYSLGVVTYELLTGRVPYSGEKLMAVALRHVRDPVPSVRALRPEVPAQLDAVVPRAMAKRHRTASARWRPSPPRSNTALAEAREAQARGRHDDTEVLATSSRRPAPSAPEPPPGWPRPRPGEVLADAGHPPAPVRAARRRRPPARRRDPGRQPARARDRLRGGLRVSRGSAGTRQRSRSTRSPTSTRTAIRPSIPSRSGRRRIGDVATFWTTEEYRSFNKDGVGIVLDAGRSRSPVAGRSSSRTRPASRR